MLYMLVFIVIELPVAGLYRDDNQNDVKFSPFIRVHIGNKVSLQTSQWTQARPVTFMQDLPSTKNRNMHSRSGARISIWTSPTNARLSFSVLLTRFDGWRAN